MSASNVTPRIASPRVEEPGIGGPVCLESIQRCRNVRMPAIIALLAVTIAIIVIVAAGWLDWPEDFAPRRWLPIGTLAVHGYVCAMLAITIRTGNRIENRLVFIAAALAAVLGVLMTSGCAALLFFLDPASPPGWRIVFPIIAGYSAVLPVTLPAAILADRRHKRLVRAEAAAGEIGP